MLLPPRRRWASASNDTPSMAAVLNTVMAIANRREVRSRDM